MNASNRGETTRLLRELIGGGDTSTAVTLAKVRLLVEAAREIHAAALVAYGGDTGEREPLDGAIGAAFQTFGGEELHPGPFDKAAVLWRGITHGQLFVD